MALSSDKKDFVKIDLGDEGVRSFPVSGSTTIWKGALVQLDTTSDPAYAIPADNSTSNRATVGFATEKKDNSSGEDGAVSVLVSDAIHTMAGDATYPVSSSAVGQLCFASDDETVMFDSTWTVEFASGSVAGTVYKVDGAKVYVKPSAK